MSLARISRGLATSASNNGRKKIAVIGGGASGIFASIAAATTASSMASSSSSPIEVHVLEATSQTLAKVKISGGGRCNVLHDTSKPVPQLLAGYPRGRRELNGPFSGGSKQSSESGGSGGGGFSPKQAQAWFEAHGVTLKTEPDGRMFPVTDSSQTIMNALHQAAQENGVKLRLRCKVNKIIPGRDRNTEENSNNHGNANHDALVVNLTEKTGDGESQTRSENFDAVILATGSAPAGYKLASQLGHSIVSTVPSLFTLNTKEELNPDQGRFFELAGVSVPWARISLKVPPPTSETNNSGPKKKRRVLEEEGPLLITHHGLSGPAALRLSAFGARDWHTLGYQADVTVHWAPHLGTTDDIFEELWKITSLRPKKTIASACPLAAAVENDGSAIPRRLWASQCRAAGIEADQVWGQVSKKAVRKLAMQVGECVVHVTGKGQFKEEFVTAGGVALKEINMKTMQSKVCPGLYCAGEVLDIDGVTGGYNFQNAWTTGYLAGTNAAKSLL